ncbi:MAG TPA: haloalkane dehalogenase [Candidatus Binataceae bacterium]|nr:haloalkane dehalogenase [Candidatus Binataceae bacterium]
MSDSTISADDRYPRKRLSAAGAEIAYIDSGRGDPIVFLHGNPTSSYLWRNVIPHLEGLGRCLAPDLVGMGESSRAPDGSYRFVDHARYLDAWFSGLGLTRNVTLVVHDWGSALGFHWANRNRASVKGIAYMEAIVTPLQWDDWPEQARKMFQLMRSPAGEALVLEKNIFVERILPGAVLRTLPGDEMSVYRRPYLEAGESRRPVLTWPREIPIEGAPADVTAIVNDYSGWLGSTTSPPKLFVNAEPGSILIGRQREFCRAWPNQREVTVSGSHFVQEDSPHQIGEAVAAWYRSL